MFLVSFQCTVQVKLELGHRAQLRKKVTSEGFTHDWMVFVRGPETGDIQHFIDKVVFRLHESFPKPKRGTTEIFDSQCGNKLLTRIKSPLKNFQTKTVHNAKIFNLLCDEEKYEVITYEKD